MSNIKAFESFIAEAVKKGIESALAEGKGKSTDKSDNFDHVGKKHLKDENAKKEAKKEIKKAKKITRSQLAEGVRKALRMALNESGKVDLTRHYDAEDKMHYVPDQYVDHDPEDHEHVGFKGVPTQGVRSKKSGRMVGWKKEGLSDGDVTKRGTSTYGNVPSPDELQAALDENGGWHMDLQGGDYLAFAYALEVAGVGNPDMNSGVGMHQVLTALSNAPSPEELPDTVDDEEIENPHSYLNKTLNSWHVRYGRSQENIEDRAQRLASDILGMLGWEWI